VPAAKRKDILGQVYEYFLGQFASAEGKKGGQFYTPASIVQGAGGRAGAPQRQGLRPLLRLRRHVCAIGKVHRSPRRQARRCVDLRSGIQPHHLAAGGDEPGDSRHRLQPRQRAADTFTRNQHPDLRADFVLANPPFNISDWWHGSWKATRAGYTAPRPPATPTTPGCNTCSITCKPGGRAGIVLANGSMSSSQNSEGDIRRAMVEADVVEVMVALPGQLFFNTQIPACLWFLAKQDQMATASGQVLFIDARKLGRMVKPRAMRFFEAMTTSPASPTPCMRGAVTARPPQSYADIPGFCRSVPLAEIAEHGHVLTPGRYVGAEAVEDDDEAFAEKMARLTEQLANRWPRVRNWI
jgi:type I restriction enzyme M protein